MHACDCSLDKQLYLLLYPSYLSLRAPLIVLLCDELRVAHCSNKIIHGVNNLQKELLKKFKSSY